MSKFVFEITNIKDLYNYFQSNKHKLNIQDINLINYKEEYFLSPLEGIHINISLNQLNPNYVSVLAIIKSSNEDIKEINLTPKSFSGRYIENFGIYFFAGRPELELYNKFSQYLNLNDKNSFISRLKELENLIEETINQVYHLKNIKLTENIELKLVIEPAQPKPLQPKKQNNNNEIPEALKKLYQRNGNL